MIELNIFEAILLIVIAGLVSFIVYLRKELKLTVAEKDRHKSRIHRMLNDIDEEVEGKNRLVAEQETRIEELRKRADFVKDDQRELEREYGYLKDRNEELEKAIKVLESRKESLESSTERS
jgi:septal ring factor EnvC (AmiA/AmiB activator)